MRKVIAVAWREVEERRHFLLISIASGVLVLIVPLLRQIHGSQRYETVRDLAALTIAGGLGLSFAVILGATVVVRDLTERRLGFYFSRPLSAGEIWSGKVLGAFLLTTLTVVLTLLPSTLLGGGAWRAEQVVPFEWHGATSWAAVGAVLLFAILASHGISTMVRSRSKWLGWDLVALTVIISALGWFFLRLLFAEAFLIGKWFSAALVIATFGTLAIAGWVQLARGRTDPVRGHRVLSSVLWSMLLVFVLLALSYYGWLSSSQVADLHSIQDASVSPGGDTLAVTGARRGGGDFALAFLSDTSEIANGERITPSSSPVFARESPVVAWIEKDLTSRQEISWNIAYRTASANTVVHTKLWFRESVQLALNPAGRVVAAASDQTLSFFDLRTERLIASFNLAQHATWSPRMFLLNDRTALYWTKASGPGEIPWDIYRIDLAARTMTKTGSFPFGHFLVDGTGQRILSLNSYENQSGGRAVTMRDAVSGAAFGQSLSDAMGGRFLADRRAAVLRRLGGATVVTLIGRDGREMKTMPVWRNSETRWSFAGEVRPGVISLWEKEEKSFRFTGKMIALDTRTGGTIVRRSSLRPLGVWRQYYEPGFAHRPGSLGTRLASQGDTALFDYDPITNRKILLAGREKR